MQSRNVLHNQDIMKRDPSTASVSAIVKFQTFYRINCTRYSMHFAPTFNVYILKENIRGKRICISLSFPFNQQQSSIHIAGVSINFAAQIAYPINFVPLKLLATKTWFTMIPEISESRHSKILAWDIAGVCPSGR